MIINVESQEIFVTSKYTIRTYKVKCIRIYKNKITHVLIRNLGQYEWWDIKRFYLLNKKNCCNCPFERCCT